MPRTCRLWMLPVLLVGLLFFQAQAASGEDLIPPVRSFLLRETPKLDPDQFSRLAQRLRRGSFDVSGLQRRQWQINGQTREALVARPTKRSENPPVVFAFHGHGGSARHAARNFGFHALWPEAVCVYPQGLPTPVPVLDPQGKFSGWQKSIGDQQDRDIEFFDAMLKSFSREFHIDPQRIYVAGHSNGGFFSYVLWSARGQQIAAIAPVAALNVQRDLHLQTSKPVLHVAGEKDSIVPFQFQMGTIRQLRIANGCDETGKKLDDFLVEYESNQGAPVRTLIHPGGHEIPQAAPSAITRFFQQHSLKLDSPKQ